MNSISKLISIVLLGMSIFIFSCNSTSEPAEGTNVGKKIENKTTVNTDKRDYYELKEKAALFLDYSKEDIDEMKKHEGFEEVIADHVHYQDEVRTLLKEQGITMQKTDKKLLKLNYTKGVSQFYEVDLAKGDLLFFHPDKKPMQLNSVDATVDMPKYF